MLVLSHIVRRLLAKLELEDTTQELKYLELLKFRFGEAALHHCEIMLRDVEDSKRLNKWVHGGFVQATIISQVFWPVVPDSTVALHPSGAVWARPVELQVYFVY